MYFLVNGKDRGYSEYEHYTVIGKFDTLEDYCRMWWMYKDLENP